MSKKEIDWENVGLGTKRDVDIARELGISDSTVWQHRKELGIPKYTSPDKDDSQECSGGCSACSCREQEDFDELDWIIDVQAKRIDKWLRCEEEDGVFYSDLTDAISVFLDSLKEKYE